MVELGSKLLPDLVHPDDLKMIQEYFEKLKQGKEDEIGTIQMRLIMRN